MSEYTSYFSASQIPDLSNLPLSGKGYGGLSGRKIGVVWNGDQYLLKFQGNLKLRSLTGEVASYGNNPVAEYIASHVFELVGMEVHETHLASYKGKQVVACKDFGDGLYEFRQLMPALPNSLTDDRGDLTAAISLEIEDILLALLQLEQVPFEIHGAFNQFIQMFIVDALNGNPDRNLGNWGYIRKGTRYSLAPVYDNGSCLFVRFSEDKMKQKLSSYEEMYQLAVSGFICRFLDKGHKLNPYRWIENNCADVPFMMEPFSQVVQISLKDIEKIINDATDSKVAREFYLELYRLRLNELKRIYST